MTTKREAILQATLELVSEHGFHGTAMSMIAEKANVGAGTIYRYFDGKESLMVELYLEIKQEMGRAIAAGYDEAGPLRERFRTLWLNMFHYHVRHPREMAFTEQFANSPYTSEEIEQAYRVYFAPLARFFEFAQSEGVFKKMPLQMVGAYSYGVIVSLAKQSASGALTLDEATTELAIDASWDALSR